MIIYLDSNQDPILYPQTPTITTPPYQYIGLLQAAHPTTVQNFINMGLDEMHSQKDLKTESLNKIEQESSVEKLFYCLYAEEDGWVNEYAPEQMKRECPEIEVEILSTKELVHGWCCEVGPNRVVEEKVIDHMKWISKE